MERALIPPPHQNSLDGKQWKTKAFLLEWIPVFQMKRVSLNVIPWVWRRQTPLHLNCGAQNHSSAALDEPSVYVYNDAQDAACLFFYFPSQHHQRQTGYFPPHPPFLSNLRLKLTSTRAIFGHKLPTVAVSPLCLQTLCCPSTLLLRSSRYEHKSMAGCSLQETT